MIRLFSGCKINLGLRVGPARPDGYHDLASLFYPLPWPRDMIVLEKTEGAGLTMAAAAGIPPEANLIFRAYAAHAAATGWRPGLKARLAKRVPMGAGLGGGSANAAALLLWLGQNAPEPLPRARLMEIGAALGADIPFFFENRPCFVTGKGEKLAPAALPLQDRFLVIACPAIPINTAWAFAELDRLRAAGAKSLTKAACEARVSNSTGLGIAEGFPDLTNDLEDAVFPAHAELACLKRRFLELGAEAAAMSGSGSAIYGIFASLNTASAAAAALRKTGLRTYGLPMRDFGM